ncbi:MAG: conjugative transfer region protein (TIGR03748 family) [Francisellaceae bacterium]|jgi:conjugative transfer region protein (TIGR03748 family)
MKINNKKAKHLIISTLVGSGLALTIGYATTIQTSRYTMSEAGLNTYQKNLLQQTVTMTFPQHKVTTIDQAVKYLLRFSGYNLVPQSSQSAALKAILAQQLPESLRTLRNVTIEQGLSGLVGKPFQVLDDPIHRLISFRLRPSYQLFNLKAEPTKPQVSKQQVVLTDHSKK